MTDIQIRFTPSGARGAVSEGTTILQAARTLGVDLDSVCGGRGVCSRCQVAPQSGDLAPRTAVEDRYDRVRGLPEGRRLGCQARLRADAVVDVPPESQIHRQVVRKAPSDRVVRANPAVTLRTAAVATPDMDAPSGDRERLAAALGVPDLRVPLPLLRRMQGILRDGGWRVTAALNGDRLVALWPGERALPPLGLAIDLGSTTVAGHLCDLSTGAVLASAGVMNRQIRFGEDLMSRVSHAMMDANGTAAMARAAHDALGEVAGALCAEAGVEPEDILDAVIVCNPVMHHILLGIDPSPLGQAPFALAAADAMTVDAADAGLLLAPGATAYIPPCIAGHVGADAAAVALAEVPDTRTETTLIVDVGTNAEIILATPDAVLACSSPTGPAFEGAQISAGQRAAPGAIERVRIDPATKAARFRVIGDDRWSDDPGFDAAVTGICGSGIIEAVAEMRMAGILDASGLIGGPGETGSDRCIADGRTHAFLLHDGPGRRVAVTQNDVRAIQLAKSALHAGARLLMDEAGVDAVDRVTLAGAFGAHISPRHAAVLGMIPDAPLDAVRSAGNAAGHGARMALCDADARRRVERLAREITKIETALAPRFQEHFVAANALPHATDPYPRLRAATPLPEPSFAALDRRPRRRRDRAALVWDAADG